MVPWSALWFQSALLVRVPPLGLPWLTHWGANPGKPGCDGIPGDGASDYKKFPNQKSTCGTIKHFTETWIMCYAFFEKLMSGEIDIARNNCCPKSISQNRFCFQHRFPTCFQTCFCSEKAFFSRNHFSKLVIFPRWITPNATNMQLKRAVRRMQQSTTTPCCDLKGCRDGGGIGKLWNARHNLSRSHRLWHGLILFCCTCLPNIRLFCQTSHKRLVKFKQFWGKKELGKIVFWWSDLVEK